EREFSFATQRRLALEMLPARLARVLDLGCGPALLAETLLERAEEFWGIDISPQMIAHGRARMQNHALRGRCHLSVGDSEALGQPPRFARWLGSQYVVSARKPL